MLLHYAHLCVAAGGQQAIATITTDDMVGGAGDVMELTRGQETELPQALKWQLVRPDEEYDAATLGFTLLDTIGQAAQIGALAADLPAGPVNRFDHGNELLLDLSSGTLTSVTDLELFAGANALTVESASGIWEIIQFGIAELVATGRYRLTRLLRGQRGTGDAMGGNPAPPGARVVILGSGIQPLSIAEADLGLPWNWRTAASLGQNRIGEDLTR